MNMQGSKQDAQHLIQKLYVLDLSRGQIFTRLLAEGYSMEQATQFIADSGIEALTQQPSASSEKLKNEDLRSRDFEPHGFLKLWTWLHLIAIVNAIVALAIATVAFLVWFPIALITGFYLIDACVQLRYTTKLHRGQLLGYRALNVMFVVRVAPLFVLFLIAGGRASDLNDWLPMFYIVLGNGFDALLLTIGVRLSPSVRKSVKLKA